MDDDEKIDAYIEMLASNIVSLQSEDQKGSIRWYIKWYQMRYPSRRLAYRVAGFLTLVLILLTPLWVLLAEEAKFLMAGFVTFIGSLAAFFSWKSGWSGYYLAQLNLTHLLEVYSLKIYAAKNTGDRSKAIELINKATQDLSIGANRVISDETKGYFSSFKFPSLKVLGKTESE